MTFFFCAIFFFAFRSTAVVYVHDMSMCWSRFVLICLFASRFPADHRTKNNWLRTSSEVESRDEKRQLPVIWYSSRISSPVPTCLQTSSTCNQQASSTLRALAPCLASGLHRRSCAEAHSRPRENVYPPERHPWWSDVSAYWLLSVYVCLGSDSAAAAVLVLARSRKQKPPPTKVGVST